MGFFWFFLVLFVFLDFAFVDGFDELYFVVFALGERREFWIISSYSFSNFKTKATQTLLLKLSHFSLLILKDFSMISPGLCKLPLSNCFSAFVVA